MKRVLLRAPVLTQSGYGVHSRQIARWLMSLPNVDLTIQALPWGITPWLLDNEDPLVGKMMLRCMEPQGQFDISFQVQLPNEWDSSVAAYNVGITAGVETDRCNPAWIQHCNNMDRVIVPSKHTKASFERHCLMPLMTVIPEAFPDAILECESGLELPQVKTKFNFLLFGQITGNNPENDRKNIFHTIRMMCDAFSNNQDVGLIIKTNSGKATKIDRQLTRAMLRQVIAQVNKVSGPKIYLVHGHLNECDVASLYRSKKINALVTLTRGEGFGLPILEAAASDLPVIATNWSAYLDFMNLGRFVSVDYDLTTIHPTRQDQNIFMPDSMWANVNEDDFKKKVIKFYNKSVIPMEWAADLGKTIRSNYSFSSIAAKYSHEFAKVLDIN